MSRIAIVGAGIAGLHAALMLQDVGLSCDIYEASNRIGGRMHSDAATWADGMVSEWCGEFIDGDHATLHDLIRRVGIETVDLGAARGDRARSVMFFHNAFYGAEAQARDFERLAPLLEQQTRDVDFPVTHARHTKTAYRLDQMSVQDWIAQYVEHGGESQFGCLLRSACTGYFGLDIREQSALNLLSLFGPQAASAGAATSRPLQGSSKIVSGSQQLPLALARRLPEDCIHLGHELVALERHDDDALTLTFTGAGGRSQVRCERVILTLPFSVLRGVDCERAGFDSLKRTAIDQLGYGTISKLTMQFDQRYWDGNGPGPRAHNGFIITDLDIQTLWDASLGQAGPSGLLVDYTSGHRGATYAPPGPYSTTDDSATIQAYAHECLRQLERVFPGITAHYTGRASLSYPTGDPYLRGSYACWRVGQCTRFGGYEGVRQGPIHFAGEHCSVELQGFMEGAAREGARAAREIVQELDA